MHTTGIIITACTITSLSILLKFVKLSKENVSIFLDIKKKSDEMIEKISQQRETEGIKSTTLRRFRLAISDWFSAAAIVIISYFLLYEYFSIEFITTASVYKIGLLFTLLLFNIIFLAVSTIERRIIYWIDEFIIVVEHIYSLIESNENKKEQITSKNISKKTRRAKKKRRTQLRRK